MLTDPPEHCAEFTMLVLGRLGVGSGWYIGEGGEYGGGAAGLGGVGVLTHVALMAWCMQASLC